MNIYILTFVEGLLVLIPMVLTLSEIVGILLAFGISLRQMILLSFSHVLKTNLLLLSCVSLLLVSSILIITSFILNWINSFSRAFQITRLVTTFLFILSGIYFTAVMKNGNSIINDIIGGWNNTKKYKDFQIKYNCLNETNCRPILEDKVNETLNFGKSLIPSLSLFWISTVFYLILFFVVVRLKKIYVS